MTGRREWADRIRLGGLRRFATAITIFTILGHTVLGFEQSWIQPVVGVLVAYLVEIALEAADAAARRRTPRFAGGVRTKIDFLLSAHITGLAVSMLLYPNDRLWPIAFASTVAIGSKWVLRASVGGRSRHFLNPSNFGITATLLLFPWVGIAPPYHFTEGLPGVWNWVLPGLILFSGSFLNARYTRRLPLLITWVAAFAVQAAVRSIVFGTPLPAPWLPITGVAFILFTFYMVTDPATTPSAPRAQIVFGASVAACYGVLMTLHVVFGLFFALTIVCLLRGATLYAGQMLAALSAAGARAPAAPAVGEA